jgi:hypothetical protein
LAHTSQSISECANCGESLGGAFCHRCGQKATGTDIRLYDLFHEAFHELAHVDGKTLRTLRLLVTEPGRLTTEFLAGRRTHYIKPLRLYLTCSVVFFALTALVPDTSLRLIRMTYRPSAGEAPLDPATQRQWEEASTARASRAIVHDLPRAMFVLMPFFAVLTWVLYRRARPFYVAHLYYSIHFHAFVFLVLTLTIPLIVVGARPVAQLLPWAIFAYHFPSLHRVFGGTWLQTAWKGMLLWFAYLLVIVATMVGVGIWSVRNEPRPATTTAAQPRTDGQVSPKAQ